MNRLKETKWLSPLSLLISVFTLALFYPVYAAQPTVNRTPSPTSVGQQQQLKAQQISALTQRALRGEVLTPAEKIEVRPAVMQAVHERQILHPSIPRPPSINELDTVGLPYTQNFASWPPAGWSFSTSGGSSSPWQQWVGAPDWMYVPYYTINSPGEHDYALTPQISTVGVSAGELDYNWGWSYNGANPYNYNDSLYIAYTLDGGVTYTMLEQRWGVGTGANSLTAGNGANGTSPPTSGFGLSQITLPAGALGQPSVQFAWIGVNEYGNHLFVTNVNIFSLLGQASNPAPSNNLTNVPTNATLNWSAGTGATGYDVYFNTFTPPTTLVSSNQAGLTYNPGALTASTQYYWQIVSRNGPGTAAGPIWTFTTGTGAAPNAPSGGNTSAATSSSLQMNWTDNSSDETGFPITSSTDGITFNPLTTAGVNATSYNNTGLNSNTQYWYNVYAQNGGGTSIGFASANGWTLAQTPGTPASVSTGISAVTISLNNGGNNGTTQFAIYETTTSQYVQADGTLGASAVWENASVWGVNTTIHGLTASTSYMFEAKARNGVNVETGFSSALTMTTTGAYSLPYTQNFTSWPPTDWQFSTANGSASPWQQYAATPDWMYVPYYTVSSDGEHDYALTPPITTVGQTAVLLQYDWAYGTYNGYNDTLYVAWTTDGGTTYNILTSQWGNGSGANSLMAPGNETGDGTTPPTSGWLTAQIPLPAGALGQSNLQLAFIGVNEFGNHLFITNVNIYPASGPLISFAPTPVNFNNCLATDGPFTANSWVYNNGGDTLHITNVTGTTVTPNWTSQTIAAGDSFQITATWSPTVVGALSDNLVFTSDSPTSPNSLPVIGNSVNPVMTDVGTVDFGTFVAGGTVMMPVAVTNTGVNPISITGVSSPSGDLVPSWTSMVIGGAATDTLWYTWHPLNPSSLNGMTSTLTMSQGNLILNLTGNATGIYSLPYTQDFSGTFPPTDWSIINPDNSVTWSQYGGTPNWAYVDFWNYTPSAETDYLVSPVFTTVGVSAAEVDFNWSYNGGYVGSYDDSMEVAYSTDNGTTWNVLWGAAADGNPMSLVAGTGTGTTNPATSNFGVGQIPLPAGALGQSSVMFAWIAYNDYGPDLFVTNIDIHATTHPDINLSSNTINYGYQQVGNPDLINVWVYSTGTAPLNVSNVMSASGDVAPGWTSNTIANGDSMLLGFTWTPSVTGVLASYAVITSDANSAPSDTVWLNGNGYIPAGVPNLTIAYDLVGHNANLSWPMPAGTIDGYKIYRETTTGNFNATVGRLVATNTGAGTTTYQDAGATGHDYYEVTAYNAASSSSLSIGSHALVVRSPNTGNGSSSVDRVIHFASSRGLRNAPFTVIRAPKNRAGRTTALIPGTPKHAPKATSQRTIK